MNSLMRCMMLLFSCLLAQAGEPLTFLAKDAKITKAGLIHFESGPEFQNIGGWTKTNAVVSWSVPEIPKGTYRVLVVFAIEDGHAGGEFEVVIGGQRANFTVCGTGGWTQFREEDLGPVMIRKTGPAEIVARVTKIPRRYGINLRAIKLVPVP